MSFSNIGSSITSGVLSIRTFASDKCHKLGDFLKVDSTTLKAKAIFAAKITAAVVIGLVIVPNLIGLVITAIPLALVTFAAVSGGLYVWEITKKM